MKKDFDNWNQRKKELERFDSAVIFHERENWWCSVGLNIGDEQDGKNNLFERPVLVFKKFNRKVAWVLPMSTKSKIGIHYSYLFYSGKKYTIILSQLRLVSIKRFRRFIRKISPYQFFLIQEKVINLIRRK